MTSISSTSVPTSAASVKEYIVEWGASKSPPAWAMTIGRSSASRSATVDASGGVTPSRASGAMVVAGTVLGAAVEGAAVVSGAALVSGAAVDSAGSVAVGASSPPQPARPIGSPISSAATNATRRPRRTVGCIWFVIGFRRIRSTYPRVVRAPG